MGTSFQVDEGNMRGVKVYDRRRIPSARPAALGPFVVRKGYTTEDEAGL